MTRISSFLLAITSITAVSASSYLRKLDENTNDCNLSITDRRENTIPHDFPETVWNACRDGSRLGVEDINEWYQAARANNVDNPVLTIQGGHIYMTEDYHAPFIQVLEGATFSVQSTQIVRVGKIQGSSNGSSVLSITTPQVVQFLSHIIDMNIDIVARTTHVFYSSTITSPALAPVSIRVAGGMYPSHSEYFFKHHHGAKIDLPSSSSSIDLACQGNCGMTVIEDSIVASGGVNVAIENGGKIIFRQVASIEVFNSAAGISIYGGDGGVWADTNTKLVSGGDLSIHTKGGLLIGVDHVSMEVLHSAASIDLRGEERNVIYPKAEFLGRCNGSGRLIVNGDEKPFTNCDRN